MPSTYSRLLTHIVFGIAPRSGGIRREIREELFAYIGGIANDKYGKLIAAGCTTNHIHLLVSAKPDSSIAEIVRDIKANSSRWMKRKCHISRQARN